MFIVFEGVDRVGKTSTIDFVKNNLLSKGYDVYSISESSDPIGQYIKQSKLDLDIIVDLILNMRKEHQHLIKQFINSKSILLWDRYIDSTYVYGYDVVVNNSDIYNQVFDVIMPDLTIYLCCDINIIRNRIGSEVDRFTDSSKNKITNLLNRYAELYSSNLQNRLVKQIDSGVSDICDVAELCTNSILDLY